MNRYHLTSYWYIYSNYIWLSSLFGDSPFQDWSCFCWGFSWIPSAAPGRRKCQCVRTIYLKLVCVPISLSLIGVKRKTMASSREHNRIVRIVLFLLNGRRSPHKNTFFVFFFGMIQFRRENGAFGAIVGHQRTVKTKKELWVESSDTLWQGWISNRKLPFPSRACGTAWLLCFFDTIHMWVIEWSWLEHCFLEQFGYIVVYSIWSSPVSLICLLFVLLHCFCSGQFKKYHNDYLWSKKHWVLKAPKGAFFLALWIWI